MLYSVDFGPVEILRAETLSGAIEALEQVSPDVVLLDLTLPDSTGIETVSEAIEHAQATPVIVQTGMSDDALALQAVRMGAQDFVRKGETDGISLARSIRYAVERKRAELEIERKNEQLSASNANLRQLTYAMTHDLQTPLATLAGATDSLSSALGGTTDEGVRRWLTRIEEASRRMVEMLDELMMYAKSGDQHLRLVPMAVSDVLNTSIDALTPQAEQVGMTFVCHVDEAHVLGDRNALRHVFENIVGNAIKYAGGTPHASLTISASASGSRTQISFADNGGGIDPKDIERVLLPFKRACNNKPGTGLGLAIVRRYLEQMDGSVRLESDGHTGTTVIVELPTCAPAQDAGSES